MTSALRKRRIWLVENLFGDETTRRLTGDPGYRDEWPQWSADFEQILFARLDEAGVASLWLVDARGGQPRQIVEKITLDDTEDSAAIRIDWPRSVDWLRSTPSSILEPATTARWSQERPWN